MSDPIFSLARGAAAELARPQGDADPLDEFAVARAVSAAAEPANNSFRKWVGRSRQAAGLRAAERERRVSAQVRKANDRAVRQVDLIKVPGCRTQRGLKGSGAHRRWTAKAVLCTAFGKMHAQWRQRIKAARAGRKRKARSRLTSAVASSARAAAATADGSHGHVQRVRDAVSHLLMTGQRQGISQMLQLRPSFAVLEVRFDETHHEMKVPRCSEHDSGVSYEAGHYPFVIIKGSLSWSPQGSRQIARQELVISPIALSESCTAESMWAALRNRLPVSWEECRDAPPGLREWLTFTCASRFLHFLGRRVRQ